MTATRELAGAARLLARLLLAEVDRATATRLCEPALRDALRAIDVTVPEPFDEDRLAADYFATLLRPRHGPPPIASLWQDGRYEGDATIGVRHLAAAAGLELDPAAARGAPPDHAGCLLLLWAETIASRPEVADRVAAEHLAFVPRALAGAARGDGFYADVARAVVDLVERIRAPLTAPGPRDRSSR